MRHIPVLQTTGRADMTAACCPLNLVLAQTAYPGLSGFVPGARGSLMLDVVFAAMFVVVPVLATSIYLVRYRRRYALHKRLQLVTASVLLVAVVLFELDIRINGWEHRAAPSPYFDEANKWTCPAGLSLIVHLSFAVPTLLLWIYVVVQALRKFSRPPAPCPHSLAHVRTGWLAAAGMAMTAVTGWFFYCLAFVAA
jgi:putative membrane protein